MNDTRTSKAKATPPAARDGPRGAAGRDDGGQSEVETMLPGDGSASGRDGRDAGIRARGFGDAGSNAGEVDPGIGGSGDTIGETPDGTGGGAGFGNAIGGGGQGDVPQTADEPAR